MNSVVLMVGGMVLWGFGAGMKDEAARAVGIGLAIMGLAALIT